MGLKLRNIKGDKSLWVFIVFLMLFSILVVYSASSQLVMTYGNISSWQFTLKHAIMLGLGFLVMYIVHLMNEKTFLVASNLGIYLVIALLIFTLTRGYTIGGANASRWIFIPVVGSFQPSTLAFLVLMMFTARFIGRKKGREMKLSEAFRKYWIWVFAIIGLIFPANLSTAALMTVMVAMALIIGGYPFKELLKIGGISLAGVALLVLIFLAFPKLMPSRLATWQSRIENHFNNEDETQDGKLVITDRNYQEMHAKIAIAKGGLFKLNPGKSTEKYFLPQSVSDFIFAIIIEEYGLFGGLFVLFIYLIIAIKILLIARRQNDDYYKLLALAVGFPLIFQALANMLVAVGALPVTGQPLPLLSSGGTSILITAAAFGVILSVDRMNREKQQKDLNDFITE